MIVQSTGQNKLNTISFTIQRNMIKTSESIIRSLVKKWHYGRFSIDKKISIVSVVGLGMKSHTGVAAKMFSVLSEHGINIEMISTSEIKISCVINAKKGEEALKLIHGELCSS